MTGRDLIIYIMTNHLEDEQVIKDGKFIGFMTVSEAAVKWNVGVATIYVWASQKRLDGILIGDILYIPANAVLRSENEVAKGVTNNG